MSEWKTVRLGDVFELQMGKTPDRKRLDYFKGSHKWISIADISKSEKYISETKESLTDDAISSSGIKIIPKDTVIMSFKLTIGKTAITSNEMYSNEAIMAFLPNKKYETDNSFLYHLFSNKNWSEGSNKAVKGITLNKASLSEMTILLPPLETQKQIAAVLDKCTSLISKYKKILEKYDTLIKSRFIEMFGDPVQNPMKWEIKPMGELLSLLTDFSSNGSYKTLDSNVIMYDEPNYALMIRTTDLESGDFSNNVKWVDEKAYNLLSKSKVFGKEIIMNKIGSAGKVYLMPELNRPVTLGRNAFLFRYKENINSVYIYFLLTSEYGQNEIKPYIRGAVTKTITKDDARKIRIPVPPITLQNKFENFVQQIDKSKFAVQKSLEKAETLYKSLMQEYFG